MASLATLIVSALCFSTLLSLAHAKPQDQFNIQGRLYCDPCRLEFETKISHPLSGVKVHVECKKPGGGEGFVSKEGYTDKYGVYSIPMEAGHEDETCELKTTESTNGNCTDTMSGKPRTIALSKKLRLDPAASLYVDARAMGFMTKGVDPRCVHIVREFDLLNMSADD